MSVTATVSAAKLTARVVHSGSSHWIKIDLNGTGSALDITGTGAQNLASAEALLHSLITAVKELRATLRLQGETLPPTDLPADDYNPDDDIPF